MAELTLEALQQQFNDLKKRVNILEGNSKRKIDVEPKAGNQFELAGLKWKILDVLDSGCMCLAEKLEKSMTFDSKCNDWRTSELRQYLNNDFLRKLEKEIGEENIIEFERDLLSADGQKEYEKCKDKVSMLALDEYRKYRSLIPNEEYYWWLLTPWSTPHNGYYKWMAVVVPSGNVVYGVCRNSFGVRPVCIFSPSIFAKEIKQ
mgnify:FL=1|nr:MAG TPA: hypothetical protein [Bacteriophage sp.]